MNKSTFNALFKDSALCYDILKNNELIPMTQNIDFEVKIVWIHNKNFKIDKNIIIKDLVIKNRNFTVFRMKQLIKDYVKYFKGLSVSIINKNMQFVSIVGKESTIVSIYHKNQLIAYSKNFICI